MTCPHRGKMTKREKPSRKFRKVSPAYLDKNLFRQNADIIEVVASVVNMSTQFFNEKRIKFKSAIKKKKNPEDSLSSTSGSYGGSTHGEDYISYLSDDYSEILDSISCYHSKCSFAFNLTPNSLKHPYVIAESVPAPTFQRLAKLWDLDPHTSARRGNTCKLQNVVAENEYLEKYFRFVERDMGIRSEISEDLQVEADSVKQPRVRFMNEAKKNRYVKFLRRDIDFRQKESAKTNLRRQAKKVTKRIIKNFLDWYQSLGGDDGETLLDESNLQELFQIGFDLPESKALVVKVKELPTVPESLANLRNEPKHATRYALKQILKQDIQREKIPPKMFAFGSMLPKENPPLRYKPPRNSVKETWMECSRVPKDLDSMKTIWHGLERLRSTIAFANWLNNHPHVKPPPYLKQNGLLNINYEEWNQIYKGFELDSSAFENFDAKRMEKASTENV